MRSFAQLKPSNIFEFFSDISKHVTAIPENTFSGKGVKIVNVTALKIATVSSYSLAGAILCAAAFCYVSNPKALPEVVISSAKKSLIQGPNERRAIRLKKPVIVAFVDFQCPFCRSTIPELLDWPPVVRGEVSLSVRQLLLSALHAYAYPSAVLFEMRSRQNGPYEAAKTLLREDIPKLMADGKKLDALMGPKPEGAARLARKAVELDASTAHQLEVQGTPSFFVLRSSREWRHRSSSKRR